MADSYNHASVPVHLAVIPDGNRRWAKQRGLPTQQGHKAGYETLKRIADAAFERGVTYVTGYVFSAENWSRSKEEVGYLMKLTAWVLREEGQEFHRKGIRINVLGSRQGLDDGVVQGLKDLEDLTKQNTKGTINICFNYGGRRDIVEAVNRLLDAGIERVDEAIFGLWLSTKHIPDPDMIVRTSGEQRLSNYLIWESAYSELYFTDVLWPDFSEADLDQALAAYAGRKRNFGV
jgi:undecaprenyl diphosphate synthase